MPRPVQHWLQKFDRQVIPVPDQMREQLFIRFRILAKFTGSRFDGTMKDRRLGAGKRMRQRKVRMDPAQAVFFERKLAKER